MKLISTAALLAGTLAVLAPTTSALAHHSHAMFDETRTVTITGTVVAYRYSNPHVFLFVEAPDEDGEIAQWVLEMGATALMLRRGIGPKTFTEGDEVTVSMYPLRNGDPGGNLERVEQINDAVNTDAGRNWVPAVAD